MRMRKKFNTSIDDAPIGSSTCSIEQVEKQLKVRVIRLELENEVIKKPHRQSSSREYHS